MVIRATLWIPACHRNKPANTAVQNCTRQSIFLTEQVLALSMAHLSHFQDQANVAVQPCACQPCSKAPGEFCLSDADVLSAMILPGSAFSAISQTSKYVFGSPLPTLFFSPSQTPFFSPSLSLKDSPSLLF